MRRILIPVLGWLIVAAMLAGAGAAGANWLTALTKGTGKAARHTGPDLGSVGKAARHLHDLPDGSKGALAAHATPEGHWQFANKDGQTFTAGTADEMQRAIPTLAPDAPLGGEGRIALYLSEDSVFANRAHLDKLPNGADLHVVTDAGALPVSRGSGNTIKVAFKPNVAMEIADERLFKEALSLLSRPLRKSEIRTLAVQPGAEKSLASAPRLEPATRMPLVDEIDPANLASSFRAIRGQTALMVARVEKGRIAFQPGKGGEIVRDAEDILAAARNNDVNLILLHADAPRQPGGRNWLWQKIEVGGLDEAISKSTLGDFLDALGAKRSPLALSMSDTGTGRVRLRAVQDESLHPIASAENKVSELLSHVTGEVVTKAAEVYARDEASQTEIDARLIPGIPSYVQIPYFVGIVFGIMGWSMSRAWWAGIWPRPERRADQGRIGHWLQGVPNFLVFFLGFLPLAGGPAFIWTMILQIWIFMTAPFRWIAKLLRRRVEV